MKGESKQGVLTHIILLSTLCAALFGAGCGRAENPAPNSGGTSAPPPAAQQPPDSQQTGSREAPNAPPGTAVVSYAPVVKRAAPAVVTIQSARRVRTPQQYPFMDDPRFREFFGERGYGAAPQRQAPALVQQGLGSGVIVSADGYILTNHHVIDGAEEIRIGLNDRRSFAARLVGSDPPSDLALLKVDAAELPVLALGDSDRVEVGDVVLAVGNPLGIGQTVTAGIISAKNRATGMSDGSFEDFLQTDAPINQGNSGGALISTTGELIGINSQILSPTGGNIGIGFSIPSNMAKNVMDQLKSGGSVRRGQLGVVVLPVTTDVARQINLNEARGVFVVQIQPGSAAEGAGLRHGDVITAIDGDAVGESNQLRNRVANTAPGTEITLSVWRDGGERQLRAKLGEMPAAGGAGGR